METIQSIPIVDQNSTRPYKERSKLAIGRVNWTFVDLPYLHGDKTSILLDAIESTHTLELDFDTVLANTITSYNPDQLGRSSGKADQISNVFWLFMPLGVEIQLPIKIRENVLEHALMVESKFKGGEHLES